MSMMRRNLYLPDELWENLKRYAIELSAEEGTQVSTSEVARRILEGFLEDRKGAK